jgi:hypothetical protein
MDGPDRDRWLLAAGLLYPVAAFGVLLGCGGAMGPLAFHPQTVLLPALALATADISLRLGGVRVRWASIALFLGWLAVVVWLQWLVLASASVAV